MAAVTFDSKLTSDGSLAVPDSAIDALGARPGERIRVRLETTNGATAGEQRTLLSEALSDLLQEAEGLESPTNLEGSNSGTSGFDEILKEKYRRLGLDV